MARTLCEKCKNKWNQEFESKLDRLKEKKTCALHLFSSQNISGLICLLKRDPVRSLLPDNENCAKPAKRAAHKQRKQNVCGTKDRGISPI